MLEKNTEIAKYSFKNNYISDTVAEKMLMKVKDNKNVFIIEMPECISYELKQAHVDIMKKRKPKKKGKKGSKVAKKK